MVDEGDKKWFNPGNGFEGVVLDLVDWMWR